MITRSRQTIEETLSWLSSLDADPANGMTRLLYSPEWLETQRQFKRRMAANGLEIHFNEVGNLHDRLGDTEYLQEVVLSDSHIGTVVNDGSLDGQFGALAAWLAIDWLKTQYGAPLCTVEVVAMTEEEGSRFPYVFWGSENISGPANPDDVRNICDTKRNSFVDAMEVCGFTLSNAPLTPRQDIKALVELHIEQGYVLESNGQSVGVVNAIIEQRRYMVTLNSESNHADTTPMGYRRDMAYASNRICHQSIGKAKKMDDPLVLTFSKVEPRPNTVNMIPSKTAFIIGCHHTGAAMLHDFTQ